MIKRLAVTALINTIRQVKSDFYDTHISVFFLMNECNAKCYMQNFIKCLQNDDYRNYIIARNKHIFISQAMGP